MKKGFIASIFVLLAALGILVAQAGAKKREFTGLVTVQIFEKDASGKFQAVDELRAQSVKFVTSVADVAGQKNLATDFAFSGRTTKGRTVSVRLKPGGSGDANLATGLLALNLPFEITVEGKRADSLIKMTTESVAGAAGPVSGRRAVIDKNTRTAKLALVGSTTLVSPIELNLAPSTAGRTVDEKVQDRAEQKQANIEARQARRAEVMLVVNGDGTLKALD